jgi:uncharacterized protein with predicted RNA binding PUA domain
VKSVQLVPEVKIGHHIDALFGNGIFEKLKASHSAGDFSFEYSKRTGRMRYFFISHRLAGTLKTDGGIALTLLGASELLKTDLFLQNCVIPVAEVIPFVSSGGSLFCKHVEWCGSNVKVGSEAAIVDQLGRIVAVGRARIGSSHMKSYGKGVAVKVREGLKSTPGAIDRHDAWRQSGHETNVGQDGPRDEGHRKCGGSRD